MGQNDTVSPCGAMRRTVRSGWAPQCLVSKARQSGLEPKGLISKAHRQPQPGDRVTPKTGSGFPESGTPSLQEDRPGWCCQCHRSYRVHICKLLSKDLSARGPPRTKCSLCPRSPEWRNFLRLPPLCSMNLQVFASF